MNSISPITKNNNVKFIQSIEKERIIKLYSSIGYDVERFFKDIKTIDIYECNETKLRYFHPSNIAGDAKFYEDLDKNTTNYYSNWKWEHDMAIKHVNAGDAILEIGCAYGNFLKKTISKGATKTVGLELNKNAVADAVKNGLDVRVEFIEDHAQNNSEMYDMVCSFQVVEHISDLDSFMKASIACLKKGGTLVISVPNNDCYLFKNDLDHTLNLPPHHMGLWTEESLTNIAKIYNLEVTKVYKQPAIKENYGIYYEVFLRNTLGFKGVFKSLILTITRPIVKILLGIFKPNPGVCITVVYKKK